MRIMHINPFFYPYYGGAENYLFDLCKRLSKKNSVSVFTSKLPNTKEVEEINGARVYRINSIVFKKLPTFLSPPFSLPHSLKRDLFKVCEKEKPDIIHLHNRFFLSYSSSIFFKKLLGVPFFLTLHNAKTMGINEGTDFFGQLFDNTIGKRIMLRSDWIIANSKWTLDLTVPQTFPRERTEVIYNGVDTKKFKKIKTDLKDELGCEFLSTTVCRLIPQKGVEYLINAIKEINGDFKAIIIGRGPNFLKLKSLVKNFGLTKKVKFVTEFISSEKVINYYSASDFSILPSLWEPFGITLIEAMACSNPIIATNVGGIPEVVTPDCGFLVEPRNPRQIAAVTNRLISDENLRKKMSKKARERCERIFDFDFLVNNVEQSYRNYLDERKN